MTNMYQLSSKKNLILALPYLIPPLSGPIKNAEKANSNMMAVQWCHSNLCTEQSHWECPEHKGMEL